MSVLQRHRWFVAAAGITLAFAVVSLTAHQGNLLTVFADLFGLVSIAAALGIAISNLRRTSGRESTFWVLISVGFVLWAFNQVAWTFWEVFLHRPIPEPFFSDIILFFHPVPVIAAVAWRPDFLARQKRIVLNILNFLMLMGWWIFLYAFIVFPHQYVVLNVAAYNFDYELLYGVQNALVMTILLLSGLTSSGGWRRVYLHFFGAFSLYAINSQFLDRASSNGTYYSGSFYDIGFIATLAWICAASLSAREWHLETVKFNLHPRWKKVLPQTAMLAILSMPVLGLWALIFDKSPATSRLFRVATVLIAMLLLGAFVFLRQYLLDQALMSLLRESRRAYESEKQLQSQLVQKEKLASLGNLIAGAAREIDHPLTEVVSYSEELSAKNISEDQGSLLRKIVQQALRTRDLVANLLTFARQSHGKKTVVDLGMLLQRAAQMMDPRRQPGKVRIQLSIQPNLPAVLANANQLFQVFVEITENAVDALDEAGGGLLEINALCLDDVVVLQFSDNGPGMRDPQRVFDPFYTTKPVGKGTGLGLSAVYGIVQDHGGQITCRNKSEGGALFILKIPVLQQPAAQSAGATG